MQTCSYTRKNRIFTFKVPVYRTALCFQFFSWVSPQAFKQSEVGESQTLRIQMRASHLFMTSSPQDCASEKTKKKNPQRYRWLSQNLLPYIQ